MFRTSGLVRPKGAKSVLSQARAPHLRERAADGSFGIRPRHEISAFTLRPVKLNNKLSSQVNKTNDCLANDGKLTKLAVRSFGLRATLRHTRLLRTTREDARQNPGDCDSVVNVGWACLALHRMQAQAPPRRSFSWADLCQLSAI